MVELELVPAGWRAWFEDGRQFTSRLCRPEAMPTVPGRCLAIVQYYQDGYRDFLVGDWWYFERGRWWVVSSAGRGGIWAPRPDAEIVLQGLEVSDEAWALVQDELKEATSWP